MEHWDVALMDLPIKKKCVMKTEAYFADTNAFLYLLEKKPFILPFTDAPWHFSVITEVSCWGGTKSPAGKQVLSWKPFLSVSASCNWCCIGAGYQHKAGAKAQNNRCTYCSYCHYPANACVNSRQGICSHKRAGYHSYWTVAIHFLINSRNWYNYLSFLQIFLVRYDTLVILSK